MARSDFRFAHPLRVRWAEVDRQDIVFNGHYLMYFDVAITEYWRAAGIRYPDALIAAGSDLFVVKATVEYHDAAHFDDDLDVAVRVRRIGRTSMTFAVEIHRGADHLVSGEVVYVNAHPTERRPMPVPDALRATLETFEGRPLAA
ncbi:MAG: acyl-CoA thioesterase [Burkholderiales bacterium]|jgi:acyl-CoA thioester hydrolase|nr:acyl-CoA thioesterase [Burkholderiales bacterium]